MLPAYAIQFSSGEFMGSDTMGSFTIQWILKDTLFNYSCIMRLDIIIVSPDSPRGWASRSLRDPRVYCP